ncbi:MAG: 30S ribosomal protein S16 [Deltaproteobacteria bacterium RIFOXYA12_FULL_58_15]|nr:MAG: 30S ribosomal protein S16 [Deltaproteobacteria bacterium RIFOXYA12_FULL_58_15]OGR12515.1 MAG: 30S ribosomal protein S16 [Deltaproteobacteria bacterium RIFOXYB12_FULL_58_9]
MAVTIRLARRGGNRRPFYHIVATDSRYKRDGRYLEQVGFYDPRGTTQLAVDEDKARKWLAVGATTSPTVKQLLKRAGIGKQVAAQAGE